MAGKNTAAFGIFKSRAQAESCVDDQTKMRWYAAEQRLRNSADRDYAAQMGFDVAQLEKVSHACLANSA